MHRIDSAGAVLARPAPKAAGTPGYWTAGDPAAGQQATVIDPDWLNAVQEELLSVLQAAGIAPSKTNQAQLLAALAGLYGKGRLAGYRVYKESGIYIPSPGTKMLLVDVQAGGGGGGGGVATGAGVVSLGAPGTDGASARSILDVSEVGESVYVTVGYGGGAGPGVAGGNGGMSSFGSLISCAGGLGGLTVSNVAPPYVLANTASTGHPVGGNVSATRGSAAAPSIALSAVTGYGGGGGHSAHGSGAPPTPAGPAADASNFGSGGGGVFLWENWVTVAGGRGAPGIVVITEYT